MSKQNQSKPPKNTDIPQGEKYTIRRAICQVLAPKCIPWYMTAIIVYLLPLDDRISFFSDSRDFVIVFLLGVVMALIYRGRSDRREDQNEIERLAKIRTDYQKQRVSPIHSSEQPEQPEQPKQ